MQGKEIPNELVPLVMKLGFMLWWEEEEHFLAVQEGRAIPVTKPWEGDFIGTTV